MLLDHPMLDTSSKGENSHSQLDIFKEKLQRYDKKLRMKGDDVVSDIIRDELKHIRKFVEGYNRIGGGKEYSTKRNTEYYECLRQWKINYLISKLVN
jgi:hypothetical protein